MNGISVHEGDQETVITLSCSRTPTFSVFKLDDPVRLFVDLSQGDTGRVQDPIVVDNGVVEQVGTLQFRTNGTPVGRIIIGMKQDAPYDVQAKGNDIVVRIDGRNRRPTAADASVLAGHVSDVREQLRREQSLLAELQAARERDAALRAREESSRKEAERLRAEAETLRTRSQEDAARAAGLARTEEERLRTLRAESAQASDQKRALEDARKKEAEQLELVKREKELASREREAAGIAARAAREKADAMETAARQAEARKVAEEQAALEVERSRKAAQTALEAEQEKLRAVLGEREAAEAHQRAARELASREKENLEQARAARQREEALSRDLADARARQAETEKRSRDAGDEKARRELDGLKLVVKELERQAATERAEATSRAKDRERTLALAQAEAKAKEAALEKARTSMTALEARVKELVAERDSLTEKARAAAAQAEQARSLAERADTLARTKAEAQREADAATARTAEQRREVERLRAAARAEEQALRELADRHATESKDLSRVREEKAQAQASYEETTRRLRDEEKRLADLAAERKAVESAIEAQRREVAELQQRRKSIETDEARTLREQLETREAEIATLRDQVARARADADGKLTAGQQRAASDLAAKETALASLRASYEDALTRERAASARKDDTIRQLTDEMGQARSEITTTREALATRESEVTALRAQLDKERTGRADRGELARLQTAIAERETALANVRRDLEARVAAADELSRRRAAEVDRLSAEIERMKTTYRAQESAQVGELRSRLGDRESEIALLKKAYEDAKKATAGRSQDDGRVARLKETLDRQRAESDRIRKEYEAALAAGKRETAEREERIRSLEGQIASLKTADTAAESREVARLRSVVADRKAALDAALKRVAKLEKSGKDGSGELKRTKADAEASRKALDKATGALSEARAREKAALEREAKAARRIEELHGALARTGQELQREKAERDRLAREVEAEKVRSEQLRAQARAESRRSEEQRKADAERIAAITADLERRQAEMDRLAGALKSATKTNGSDSRQAAALKADIEREKALRDELARTLEETRKARELAEKKAREAEARAESLRAAGQDRTAAKDRQLQQLEAEAREARAQAERVAAESAGRVQAAKAEADASRAQVERLIAELRAARNRNDQTSGQSSILLADLEREKAARDRLARELAQAHEAREKAVADDARKIAVLSDQVNSRQAEIDRLGRELADAKDRLEREAARSEAEARTQAEARANAEARADALAKAEAQAKADAQAKTEALARAEARAKAAAVPPAPAHVSPAVRAIDFKETKGVPELVVALDGTPDWAVSPGRNSYVLTLHGTTLPAELRRRMDVSAFESSVAQVTAWDDGEGSVRIVADLAQPVGQQVKVKDGRLVWSFEGPSPSKMTAGAVATPTTSAPLRAAAAEGGAAPAPAPSTAAMVPTMAAPTDGPKEYLKPSLVPKKKRYSGRHINLTVKDADIQNVLTFLAREGKINIVTSEEVRGKVTFHLEDVPWDLALDTVLKTKGLDVVIEQGIYRVAPVSQIQAEYEARVEKMKKVRELKPIVVRLVPVNYAEGMELVKTLGSVMSSSGSVELDTRTNTLILKDTEDYLTAAEDLIRKLDQQTPQILIEARIVEARTTFREDIGVQWGGRFNANSSLGNETGLTFPSSIGVMGGSEDTATGGLSMTSPHWAVNLPAAVGQGSGGAIGLQFGSVGGAATLALRLSAAEENGDVKIISSPRISTLDNRKASITQGVSIPISVTSAAGVNTQFFSADLSLNVTPHVTRDGHIKLQMQVSKNEPDFGNVAANGNPTITRKEANTELLIRDGDTTVIGGIYTRSTSKSYKKIPYLAEIPVLGWFFKTKSEKDDRSELLIFITPKVVNREVAL